MTSELIQWPRAKYWDRCWNPVIGCRPCSPACENCYAKAWAARFGRPFAPHLSKDAHPPRSGVVFCGNMTDLFGEWVEDSAVYVDRASCDARHCASVHLWLTKRVARMQESLLKFQNTMRFPNHYFGFTAEDGVRMDERSRTAFDGFPKWANLWVSAEPLLAPFAIPDRLLGGRLKWLVVGCESGPNRRPCKIEWVESIVEQCRTAGVPVFVKQLDLGGKCETDISKFPAHLQVRQVPWAGKEAK